LKLQEGYAINRVALQGRTSRWPPRLMFAMSDVV